MNKITATGRLAADAEVRYAKSGDAIAGFRLASDIGFGDKKSTNWFSCTIWGKRGEALAPYLTKGAQVTVFGSLTLREYDDKSGGKRISPDVRVDEIVLQGSKQDGERMRNDAPLQRQNQQSIDDMDSDVPF